MNTYKTETTSTSKIKKCQKQIFYLCISWFVSVGWSGKCGSSFSKLILPTVDANSISELGPNQCNLSTVKNKENKNKTTLQFNSHYSKLRRQSPETTSTSKPTQELPLIGTPILNRKVNWIQEVVQFSARKSVTPAHPSPVTISEIEFRNSPAIQNQQKHLTHFPLDPKNKANPFCDPSSSIYNKKPKTPNISKTHPQYSP